MPAIRADDAREDKFSGILPRHAPLVCHGRANCPAPGRAAGSVWAHLAYAGSNYFPFVWRAYKSHRATLFGLLDALPVRSTSQDTSVEKALHFIQAHAGRTGEWLPTTRTERSGPNEKLQTPLLDLSWVPEGWWRLLTDETRRDRFPDRVHRCHLEACVFSQLMLELKAGGDGLVSRTTRSNVCRRCASRS